jgi:N-acyl-D-aspartate/D-glutamate deacylase
MWKDGKSGIGPKRLKRALRLEDHTLTRDLADMYVERCPVADWNGLALADVFHRYGVWADGGEVTATEATAFDALPGEIHDDGDFFLALLEYFDTDLYWWTYAANTDPDALAKLLMDPQLLPGFSDSGAHLTNMAFYDANLRALKIAQRMGKVAYTVMRLTREPAQFFGLDAGTIEVGDQADITLIDPERLASYDSEPNVKSIYREAFEHEQLVNRSDGVVPMVVIGGEVVWENDGFTEVLGAKKLGRALRNQRVDAKMPADEPGLAAAE